RLSPVARLRASPISVPALESFRLSEALGDNPPFTVAQPSSDNEFPTDGTAHAIRETWAPLLRKRWFASLRWTKTDSNPLPGLNSVTRKQNGAAFRVKNSTFQDSKRRSFSSASASVAFTPCLPQPVRVGTPRLPSDDTTGRLFLNRSSLDSALEE